MMGKQYGIVLSDLLRSLFYLRAHNIEYQVLQMNFFKGTILVKEDDFRKPFLTKMTSDMQKLKQSIQQDGRTQFPKKWFEIVLNECLELMNLREVIRLIGQYKLAIQEGIDEYEDKDWNRKIQEAKAKLVETNYQLFGKFQLQPKQASQMVEEKPFPQQNLDELIHQLASLNQTRQKINLLSELIGKALNNQQVHEQLPNIENTIPKEMENMLTLLKTHLSLKQSLESEFLKKLKRIDQALIREKEDLAPFEDNDDSHQINNIYERISAFLENNKASLENLRIFNQEVVDCLRNFILQILQPLQKRKKEEIDVINILNNIGDVKNELQRVLASYKDYIQVNDENSQEMEVRLRNYSAQDEENKKKLQSLEEENKEKEGVIQRLTKDIQEVRIKLAEAQKQLEQKTQAYDQACSNNEAINTTNKQLKSQNQTLKGKIIAIRNKVTNLNLQMKKIQSAHPGLIKDVESKLIQLKQYATKMDVMKELINSLNITTAKIQALTLKLSDSKIKSSRLEMNYEQSSAELNMRAQQLIKAREVIKDYEVQLEQSEKTRERERTEYDRRIQVLDNEVKELSLKMQTLSKANSSLKLDINEMRKRQADALRENEQLLKKISNQRDYQRYFAHDLLYDFSFYRKPIIDTIESKDYQNVKASKLLFKFDPQNKVNFHRYIDEIPHILVLVKLENGRMLACYTNQPFKPQCTGDYAFIMVLNTGTTYELKKGAKAISYDEYYLLFGNSEIRLRSGESLIFSNFGIANSSFDNKGQGIDALFGEGKDKRELPIAGYEIYQIIFQEER